MKICIIGKFPPIQGGVSRDTFWLAVGLSKEGHEVHVVTNSLQVERPYRIHSPLEKLNEFIEQQGDNGGSLTCHFVVDSGAIHYIPQANPYASALAGRAINVVESEKCDLIFSYYLEPYGVAAYIAAQATGIPYGVRHAGSDVGRLMQDKDLELTYRHVLKNADFILPSATTFRRMLSIGIQSDRMYPIGKAIFPTHLFQLDSEAGKSLNPENNHRNIEPNTTIGLYGKIGRQKGTYDLIEALRILNQRSKNIELKILCPHGNRQYKLLEEKIKEYKLEQQVSLQTFRFHWEIADFIKSCSLVCFLERDFSIPIHRPLVPLEVMCTSTPLVLSREIARTPIFRESLLDGVHVKLADPKNHSELADAIQELIDHPEEARAIGIKGADFALSLLDPFEEAAKSQSNLFETILADVKQRRAIMSYQDMQMVLTRLYTDRAFRLLFLEGDGKSTATYELSEDEINTLKTINRKALESYAASLEVKVRKSIEDRFSAFLPLIPKHQWESAFRKYYDLRPSRPGESMNQRVADCSRFMRDYWQAFDSKDLKNLCISELFSYQAVRLSLEEKVSLADSFSDINKKESYAFDPEDIHQCTFYVSPGMACESFRVDVFEVMKCISEGRPLETVQSVSPQNPTSHFIFISVPGEIHARVYPINRATSELISMIGESKRKSFQGILDNFSTDAETDVRNEIAEVLTHLINLKAVLWER